MSAREAEVLDAVAAHLSNAQVARRRRRCLGFPNGPSSRWPKPCSSTWRRGGRCWRSTTATHLLAEVAAITERVLAACPGVRVLATSRERLAVTGGAPGDGAAVVS